MQLVTHSKNAHSGPRLKRRNKTKMKIVLKSVCAELSPRETLITWPILNRFPDFKDQQTYDTPDVLLALFLKKLIIPRQD